MKGHSEAPLVLSIALLGLGLYACGQMILASSGPLTGYHRLEGLLGLAAAAAGMVLVGWWAVALTLAFVSELLGRAGHLRAARVAGSCTPQFMKRLAATMVGLQLVSGIPAALATGSVEHRVASAAQSAPGDPGSATGPLPAPPAEPAITPQWKPAPAPVDGRPLLNRQTRPSPESPDTPSGGIVVGPGDTLWTIAAAHLGPFATDAEIADAWPKWHNENWRVIGENPDLLLPGQLLRVPPAAR
ncbi:LysM domain-containing protein [Arthrobacter sp. H20]|uniref:LysM peptidoglycan-binding domain-containing protein n=1 Tax=Arthrobacter sp. H20 TaxID=1267981 RepID=UPI00047C2433|nr:LysM domain-containing protein [Arthrobacter sp. H20]